VLKNVIIANRKRKMDTKGKFYLGRLHDLKQHKTGNESLLYDPDDLVTHGVVFGMTGSGKTGLCIDLLEEAALNGIPAIMIDPKGDITNALLHFPKLRPEDFEPWVNIDEARRAGKSKEDFAAETSRHWRAGLAQWGITPTRIEELAQAVEFAVYTPGSDAGLQVNILASLSAPEVDWENNKEIIRERISSTVTAILGLVGYQDIDPVTSREHILLANIFEQAWSNGKDLSLENLIVQVQTPPMEKVGILPVEKFFAAKDRGNLAMRLNNILASPSFQTWLEGQPLEIEHLLFTKSGKPRHCVFTLSHLSDEERMFFVTLLYSAIETWMYAQPGTSSLRAIVYFDEIHGYLPPVAAPPSKAPMLRMLKQARAFGVGQLLATQNPVDVDYKALSNAGTWFIGKLQAERDKDRLLDGLEGAAQGGFKRSDYDKIISALEKRIFLLHNVHQKAAQIFETRWAMNYLAGPLTRQQIPELNQLAGVLAKQKADVSAGNQEAKMEDILNSKPAVPGGVQEVFWPVTLSLEVSAETYKRSVPANAKRIGYVYRPGLVAQAQLRFSQRKYNLDSEIKKAALVLDLPSGAIRWEDFERPEIDERSLEARPTADATFGSLSGEFADEAKLKSRERDFSDWIFRDAEIKIWANDQLKVYAGPELSKDEFLKLCQSEADKGRDDEAEKARDKIETKLATLQRRLAKEQRELSDDKSKASGRKLEEYGTHAENILSLFLGRRRTLTTSLTKRRLSVEADADVQETEAEIKDLEAQIAELSAEAQALVNDIDGRWDELAQAISQIPLQPSRSDVYVSLFGIAWLPYHRVDVGGREVELPAFD
jgi:hypothetical protein